MRILGHLPYIWKMPKKAKKTAGAKVVSSKVVYRGPVFHVTTDHVREPGGVTARRDMVRHQGSVVVMPVDDSGTEPKVLLTRQYRHAAQRMMWELSAGRIDEGESALDAGKRELIEETGFRAKKWQKALFFYVSPGFLDETMTIFVARELVKGEATPEEDERITARLFPLSQAVRMVTSGKILDAKTIAGILWLNEQFGR
jgi:ADP-ribose pyrophosphatase